MSDRLYKFNWALIGNINEGRPTLGGSMRVEMYRLFQFTLRDVIEQRMGTEQCDLLLYKAGYLAGSEFCKKYLYVSLGLNEFLTQLKSLLLEYGVGKLEVEEVSEDANGNPHMQLTVSEDLDCSGLPDLHHATCSYDEGFIAGILRGYTGTDFDVREINCWCLGDECCRFDVSLK